MKTFYAVLTNTLIAALVNTFVWFAVTFWVYLETESVVVTAVMAGVYTGTVALSGVFLGTLVDRFPKKRVMLGSSLVSLLLYGAAATVYTSVPSAALSDPGSPLLWLFILLALFGALAGNVRSIALSTLVTVLVAKEVRDRANGLVGTANGVAFLAASVFSGLAVGFLGMFWTLALAAVLTAATLLHLWTVTIPIRVPDGDGALEGADTNIGPNTDLNTDTDAVTDAATDRTGLRATIAAVRAVPGLFGLIFFQTFNNFLGGVFMALMDAYGLQLVSVQVWGLLWGGLSLGFIVGGLVVARWGLGRSPLRALFLANAVMWTTCLIFPAQASVVLLAGGVFVWLCLIPVVEAAEQTILQNTIPPERQGRVFGFAQSLEQAASPVTAFLVGPLAQLVFIPFMTTGAGVGLMGGWFGTGVDRGIALVFILAGFVGLVVTLLAMRSSAYRRLEANEQFKKVGEVSRAQPVAGI